MLFVPVLSSFYFSLSSTFKYSFKGKRPRENFKSDLILLYTEVTQCLKGKGEFHPGTQN